MPSEHVPGIVSAGELCQSRPDRDGVGGELDAGLAGLVQPDWLQSAWGHGAAAAAGIFKDVDGNSIGVAIPKGFALAARGGTTAFSTLFLASTIVVDTAPVLSA